MIRTVERIAQNMFICPPHASQVAALAALDCIEEAEANLSVYAENRRLMLERLPRIGFHRIAPPQGAFYIYADISDLTDDSLGFCSDVLEQAGVAITPASTSIPGAARAPSASAMPARQPRSPRA